MSPYYDADDGYSRGRDARRPGGRDRSPDYYSGGAPPVVSGAMPAQSRASLQYEPPTPLYPPDPSAPNMSSNSLQVPSSHHRPRSLPPPSSGSLVPRRRRSDSRSPSVDDEDRPHSPLGKARHAVRDTFTQSAAGIGVGVLGAIVGGLAARELSEKARHNQNGHDDDHHHHNNNNRPQDHQASRLISTLVGAAVGGLGANALEKRLEASREKDKGEQKEWERKWGRGDARDRDDYDDRAPRRQRGRSRGPPAGYEDDDYDYVYDEPPRRIRSRHGDERYQSR